MRLAVHTVHRWSHLHHRFQKWWIPICAYLSRFTIQLSSTQYSRALTRVVPADGELCINSAIVLHELLPPNVQQLQTALASFRGSSLFRRTGVTVPVLPECVYRTTAAREPRVFCDLKFAQLRFFLSFSFFLFLSTFIDLHSKHRVTMRWWVFPKQKVPECLEKSHCAHTLGHHRVLRSI